MKTPARSVKNQYRGINAHLHSIWQAGGGWTNFHHPHITYLTTALKARLLPLGYTADNTESLQIQRLDARTRLPQSDVTIYDLREQRPLASAKTTARLSGLVLPLPDVLDDNPITEQPYSAIGIYPLPRREGQTPVAWLEILSPTNKLYGADRREYLQKRGSLLTAGIVFIELDYLHESPPTLTRIPDYVPDAGREAHPYRILVFDPRPHVERGLASFNEFDVDQPIPIITIPLRGDDFLDFDFDAPYQRQFVDMLYGLELVDYTQLPPNFDRYNHDDQTRIVNRMLTVLRAASDGRDLEAVPLPQDDLLPLDAALAQLKVLIV